VPQVEAWLTALSARWTAAGADEATARLLARLNLAVGRGLLLDLLATGDRDGVTQAYEHYLQVVEAHYPVTPAPAAEPGPAADTP
jgi:hypothetical protein